MSAGACRVCGERPDLDDIDLFARWLSPRGMCAACEHDAARSGDEMAHLRHTYRARRATSRGVSPMSEAREAAIEFHRAEDADERGEGICRTCLAPIWNEGGTVDHRHHDEGWSDRNERGGDSLICFKAAHYGHEPLVGREAAIYDRSFVRGRDAAVPVLLDGVNRDRLAEVVARGADDPTNAGADWADNTAYAVLAHLRDVLSHDHA